MLVLCDSCKERTYSCLVAKGLLSHCKPQADTTSIFLATSGNYCLGGGR